MENPHPIRFLAENQASQPSPSNLNGDFYITFTNINHVLRFSNHELTFVYIPLTFSDIALKNGAFIDGLPINNGDFYSYAVSLP